MLAWTLIRHGSPASSFELREHPDPVPSHDQVLIDCEGFGLNFADVMAVKGLYRDAPPLPSILGYEVVGRVSALGKDASPDLLGKRVVAFTFFGGYAQKAVTDHRAVVPVPDHVTIGEAASLATQASTAWYAARILCPLQPLERVLVHSAAGGVGHLLVQLSKNQGCEVIAVAGGEKKLEFLRTLGVDHVIDRKKGDYAKSIRQLLADKRIDASFNAVGGSTFKKDLSLIGAGGRLVLFGGAERGGISTLRFVWRMGFTIPIFLMMKSKSILGVNMNKLSQRRPDILASCIHHTVEAFNNGIIRPYVHKEFDHQDLPAALEALGGGDTIGKVAVRW